MPTNETLNFLNELANNNNKEWFERNKKRYELIRIELKQFISAWIDAYSQFDETYINLDPKKCMFRINRDVRFSTNKNPYKTNLGAFLTTGGKNENLAGLYLHIEPGNCFFGAGNYQPMPTQLAKIRQEIDYNYTEFNNIVLSPAFVENFGALSMANKLKRPPKGYDEDNEAIEYLKLKGFTVLKKLNDKTITNDELVNEITKLSLTAKPFVDFLNKAVEE